MKRLSTLFLLVVLLFNTLYAQELNVVSAKYHGKPIIRMTLNDKKTWVLLDTGSDLTILHTGVQDKFGFRTSDINTEHLKVPGFGSRDNQLQHTFNAKLKFGDVQLLGKVFAFDMSSISKSIESRTGKKISGIIGTSMMRKYGFVIDMQNGTAMMTVKSKKRNKKSELVAQQVTYPNPVTHTN